MKKYTQLDLHQRYTIERLVQLGTTKADIALDLDVHLSTIYRELNRNRDQRDKSYKAPLSDRKCRERHKMKAKHISFTPEVRAMVESQLLKDLSPEQISGFASVNNLPCVSPERIYQYVWNDKVRKGSLYKHLRNKGRKYRKRGSLKDSRGLIVNRIGIEKRPLIVDQKTRIGDLEVDTVIGKNHLGALVTINDRATGMLKMKLVKTKEAKVVKEAVIELLEDWKPFIHTITSDNGKEFAAHEQIAEALNVDFYFAKPYHSWQRGANENLNGLVRQYFPKKTDFQFITKTDVEKVMSILNDRPRKRFQYKSPNEEFAITLEKETQFALIT
jgi:IS30 family transposase